MEENVKNRVVGVDINMDHTTYAIVDIRGNILVKEEFATSDYPDVYDYITVLTERIIEMTEANGGYEKIRSIGVSSSSANYLTGSIENATNLPWKGVIPLAVMLRDRLGIAVAVANNAHATGLGEYAYGNAHGMRNFVLVTLGHGIGSCIFSRGRVHMGVSGFSGEIGHTCIVHNGRDCGCGRKGCLEAYCAHKGIVATARELMADSSQPTMMRSLEKLTPKTILDCCEQGDELAIEVYHRTGRILGTAMANYASLLDPEAIIYTGSIAHADHWLFDPAREAFEAHVFPNIRGKVKFRRSMIDDQKRNLLGASALAWRVKEYSLFK